MMSSANLIVATAHNTLAMNRGLMPGGRQVSVRPSVTEGMLNRMEGVIRAFDPALAAQPMRTELWLWLSTS